MIKRIREYKTIIVVLLLGAVGYTITAICWDRVVICLIDKSIQGYSLDKYSNAKQKIRRADALIKHIHKDKRQNAERLRNEGRRYLVEVNENKRNDAFFASIRMKYYTLLSMEYDNTPPSDIAICLSDHSEKDAQLFGHMMRLEDIKTLANRGLIDASEVEKETKFVEEIIRELERNANWK